MNRAARWLVISLLLALTLIGYRACAEPTQPKELVRLTTENRGVVALEFSSDGRSLLGLSESAAEKVPLDKLRDELRIWEVATWRERALEKIAPPKGGALEGAAFSPDGKLVAIRYSVQELMKEGTPTYTGAVKVYDTTTLAEKASLFSEESKYNAALGFSPDNLTLAIAWPGRMSDVGGVQLVDLKTFKEPTTLKHKLPYAFALTFTPEGKALVLAGFVPGTRADHWDDAGKVTFFDRTDGKELKSFPVQKGPSWIKHMAFFAKGQRLAVMTGHYLKLWDVSSGKEWPIPGLTDQQYREENGVSVSPDGKWLVVSDYHSGQPRYTHVRLWDLEAQKERFSWKTKNDRVLKWCFSPDSKLLAAGAGPGVVVWRVAD